MEIGTIPSYGGSLSKGSQRGLVESLDWVSALYLQPGQNILLPSAWLQGGVLAICWGGDVRLPPFVFLTSIRRQLWRSPVVGWVRIPADVCESGSWSGFQRMFFLAGLCGGGGRRGPRQGHVQLSRQRPADWVVTVLGHSASASQALGEGEGLSLRGVDVGRDDPVLVIWWVGCMCWGFASGGVWAGLWDKTRLGWGTSLDQLSLCFQTCRWPSSQKSGSLITLFSIPPLESPLGPLDRGNTLLEGDYPPDDPMVSG